MWPEAYKAPFESLNKVPSENTKMVEEFGKSPKLASEAIKEIQASVKKEFGNDHSDPFWSLKEDKGGNNLDPLWSLKLDGASADLTKSMYAYTDLAMKKGDIHEIAEAKKDFETKLDAFLTLVGQIRGAKFGPGKIKAETEVERKKEQETLNQQETEKAHKELLILLEGKKQEHIKELQKPHKEKQQSEQHLGQSEALPECYRALGAEFCTKPAWKV